MKHRQKSFLFITTKFWNKYKRIKSNIFLGTKISIINEIYQNYFSMVLRWLKYPNCSPQICNQTDKSHDFFSHKNFSTRAIKLFKRGQHIYMSMKRVSLFFLLLLHFILKSYTCKKRITETSIICFLFNNISNDIIFVPSSFWWKDSVTRK